MNEKSYDEELEFQPHFIAEHVRPGTSGLQS